MSEQDLDANTQDSSLETNDSSVDLSTATDTPQTIPAERFNSIYGQMKSFERQNQELENEINNLRNQNQPQTQQEKTLEDFDYDEDAFNRHKDAQSSASLKASIAEELREEFRKEQEQASVQQQLTTYNSRCADYARENPEVDLAFNNMQAQGLTLSPMLAGAVVKSGDPALQHELMNDLNRLHQLNQINDPVSLGLALGRLPGIQKKAPASESKAPAPAPTLGNSRGSGPTSARGAKTMAEHKAIKATWK